jgi:hypothetical protein
MELIAKPVGKTAQLVPQIVVHARVLTQFDDDGILETHPPKGRSIGAERGGQHECIAAVILRARHRVTVAEAIELLGVERVYVHPALHERVHNRSARNFNPDGHSLRSTVRQVDEPFDELSDSTAGVSHTPLRRRTPVCIDDHHLVCLGRPIDADPPAIRLVLQRQWFPPFRNG